MPPGTTGVPTTEDHAPDSVEAALLLGARLWDEQRYFEAHECLESVWHAAPEDDRDLWQGVIQVAVAGVHVQRANPVGAVALFRRAAQRLQRYPPVHRGIMVEALRERATAAADRVQHDGVDGLELPAFPAVASGAWFTADPAALEPPGTPTPLPDHPTVRRPAVPEPTTPPDPRAKGLEPGHRFRCDGCGNVTRFDVVATATTRRFHHFDLGGVGAVEEEEVLASTIESVVCRWCGRDDGIRVEVAPASGS